MRGSLVLFFSIFLSLYSCGQESKNVSFFQDTESYELAKAVEKEDLEKIEEIVKTNPNLLEVANETTGANVLSLALTLEKFEAFKKLLELGANPNFINQFSNYSILIEANRFYKTPKDYTIDLRYIKLLLKKGADPNYTVENGFTDEKGHYHMAKSPLLEASKINLEMLKLLIKSGGDPYKKIGRMQISPFESALSGFKDKFIISNYFIDTLDVSVSNPLRIGDNDTLYIQDYVVNKFTLAKLKGDSVEVARLKRENEGIEEVNHERWEFIKKLESMGVDFKNYKYN